MDVQGWAEGLRRRHYPPDRNRVPAHVTLFRTLPPSCEAELRDALARAAAACAPPPARLESVMALGGGTAFAIRSPAMLQVREELAEHLHGLLTAADDHRPVLHVTIQNKVSGKEAQALQAQLAESFRPRDFTFAGLALHAWRGGPWDSLKRWPFRG